MATFFQKLSKNTQGIGENEGYRVLLWLVCVRPILVRFRFMVVMCRYDYHVWRVRKRSLLVCSGCAAGLNAAVLRPCWVCAWY